MTVRTKSNLIVVGIQLLIVSFCIGQTQTTMPQNAQNSAILSNLSNSNTLSTSSVILTPRPPKKLIGKPYLIDEWSVLTISLKNEGGVFRLEKTKFNMFSNDFEVQLEKGTYVIKADIVESFLMERTYSKRSFKRCGACSEQLGYLDAFFEYPYVGEISLLKRSFTKLKRATYNEALMIGTKDDEIVQGQEFFLLFGDGKIFNIKKSSDLVKLNETYDLGFEKRKIKSIGIDEASLTYWLSNM